MARNIEIKAQVSDLGALRVRVQRLTSSKPAQLLQRDTFYRVPTGRLKLREIDPSSAELIYYERPDQLGPKTSVYTRTPVEDPSSMHELLERLFEQTAVVAKRREVFWVGQTRVHLDTVEGLGSFVELEVVLVEEQTNAQGKAVAAELMAQLEIEQDQLIAGAYVDLLAERTPRSGQGLS
jgi:predicted adenylyl cyclase CyaB